MDWIRCCGKTNNNNFYVERDDGLPACQLWLLHCNAGFLLVWLEGKIHCAKQRAPVLRVQFSCQDPPCKRDVWVQSLLWHSPPPQPHQPKLESLILLSLPTNKNHCNTFILKHTEYESLVQGTQLPHCREHLSCLGNQF